MYCPVCAHRVGDASRCGRCGFEPPEDLRSYLRAACATDGAGLSSAESRVGLFLEDRYRVEAPLGRGGMGAVYRATDVRLERSVAVKFLAQKLRSDPEAHARFLREARALASLRHPNVVAIHTVGEVGETPYFVLELVQGRDLGELLREQTALDWTLVADVGRQVCAGLAHIHAHGYVHRDIKPNNLMLTPEGQVVILDFGVLRDLDGEKSETSIGIGTAAYMAPEQASDPKGVEPRSDLYALGATMFELVTGARPFSGANAVELMMQHRTAPVPSPRSRGAEVPPAFERIVVQALSKTPQERLADAKEMGAALAALVPSGAGPSSSWGASQRRARRRRGGVVAALMGGVALGGLSVGLVLRAPERTLGSAGGATVAPLASAQDVGQTAVDGGRQPESATGPAKALDVGPTAGERAKIVLSDSEREVKTKPMRAQGERPRSKAPRAPLEPLGGPLRLSTAAEEDGPNEPVKTAGADSPRVPDAGVASRVASASPPPVPVPARAEAATDDRPGTLQVTARYEGQATWAVVEIDGQIVARAGSHVRRSLSPGPHRIVARRAGYRTASAEVQVLPGVESKVFLELEKVGPP